jgi:hypothetical protein
MMALGVSDPYCRFITPAELASMKKYDVTGVGLNLGTAGEYASKTGRPLPPDQPADDTGVFVVGLSKGSPADLVRQCWEGEGGTETTVGNCCPSSSAKKVLSRLGVHLSLRMTPVLFIHRLACARATRCWRWMGLT